jgi:hypothetical protein
MRHRISGVAIPGDVVMPRVRIRSRLAVTAAALLPILAAACTQITEPTFESNPLPAPAPAPAPVLAPRVEERSPAGRSAPAGFDLKLVCLEPGDRVVVSPTCPVVVYGGKEYWAFSYTDNRSSLGLVGYAEGVPSAPVELLGARYLVDVEVNATDSTVTFVGQGDRRVSVRWSALP